ncbi:MAG TPA: hypothetical protein VIT91_03015 [Chthoniobacterales bacterium]
MNFSRSTFLNQRDVEMEGAAERIHSEATTRLASLADYGVTAAALEELEDDIDAYAAIAESPRIGIAGRKTITNQLAEEFRKAESILKDILDRLALQFKTTNPESSTITPTPGPLSIVPAG